MPMDLQRGRACSVEKERNPYAVEISKEARQLRKERLVEFIMRGGGFKVGPGDWRGIRITHKVPSFFLLKSPFTTCTPLSLGSQDSVSFSSGQQSYPPCVRPSAEPFGTTGSSIRSGPENESDRHVPIQEIAVPEHHLPQPFFRYGPRLFFFPLSYLPVHPAFYYYIPPPPYKNRGDTDFASPAEKQHTPHTFLSFPLRSLIIHQRCICKKATQDDLSFGPIRQQQCQQTYADLRTGLLFMLVSYGQVFPFRSTV
ncbi:hypothetical protein F5Y06DRAFT_206387 [Hypoxylon sp. FL0890]|nr:hypothetical protein F5Y06DRAFT_206387 [Hypoxylon sp. FL0890]